MSISSEKVALSPSIDEGNTTPSSPSGASLVGVLPKALPDVDDVSMTQVNTYIENYRRDVYWSFLSDSFFLTGGICYIILSIPRLHALWSPHFFAVLDFVAPTVYLINSCVDVKWAQEVRTRTRLRNQMTETWNYWRILLDKDGIVVGSGDESERSTTGPHPDNTTAGQLQDVNSPWWSCVRFRKHAVHRRTLLAAWTFGIAAFFSVLAVITFYSDTTPLGLQAGLMMDAVSVHFYILSAIISISGKRTRAWLCFGAEDSACGFFGCLGNPEMLEDIGDILFLFGSLVDGVLCDFTFDDNRPGWAIMSACLWFVDACFYLRADYILACRMNNPEDACLGHSQRDEGQFV